MAIITEKSVVLLLVIGFLQVQARSTEFVFGPRAHIDSGQIISPQIWSGPDTEVPIEVWIGSEEDYEDYDDRKDYEVFTSDDEEFYEDEDEGSGDEEEKDQSSEENSNSDDMNSEEYSEESDGERLKKGKSNSKGKEITIRDSANVPLKRIRRRIIPVGGAAIDRSRGGRGNNGRSRSPWSEPHHYGRQRDSVIRRRNGPTGSAALFSLYPELAPPGWKEQRDKQNGQKKPKKVKKKQQDGTESPNNKKKFRGEVGEEKPQSDERAKVYSTDDVLASSKKTSKLSRNVKEEIALFAKTHGIERALIHFKPRVDVPLRANMVEKFLRRYQNRMQRRASRS